MLHEETQGQAVITTGVGQHQMWAAQWYNYDMPRCWATSGEHGLPHTPSPCLSAHSTDFIAMSHNNVNGFSSAIREAWTCSRCLGGMGWLGFGLGCRVSHLLTKD